VPFDAPCAALGLSRASVHGSDRRREPLSPKGQGIFSGFPDFPASCLHSSRPPRSARFTRRGKSRCADATRPFPRPDSSRARGARCRTSAGSARRLRVSHAPTPRGGRARAAVALGTILLSSACPSGRIATSRRCASSATEARENPSMRRTRDPGRARGASGSARRRRCLQVGGAEAAVQRGGHGGDDSAESESESESESAVAPAPAET
jgi:hypothetical protein